MNKMLDLTARQRKKRLGYLALDAQNSLRYLKRATNQLVKAVKSLKDA